MPVKNVSVGNKSIHEIRLLVSPNKQWTWVRDALDHASDTVVDPAERALAARVLDALRDTAPVDQAAEAAEEYEGNAEGDNMDSAAAVAIVTSVGDAERPDGQGEP